MEEQTDANPYSTRLGMYEDMSGNPTQKRERHRLLTKALSWGSCPGGKLKFCAQSLGGE
jgi:hypothetical protein